MKTLEYASIDELCSKIDDVAGKWDTRWFRGTKNPNYSLVPKLMRDPDLLKREQYISVEFRRRAHSSLPQLRTPFEWLCAMQHFGVPTRLLDWTESLPVALYFSIRPWSASSQANVLPTIWMLDPFSLSTESKDKEIEGVIPINSSPIVSAMADLAFHDDEDLHLDRLRNLPIPICPNMVFDRLRSQNGCFTIHGTDKRGLEIQLSDTKNPNLIKFVAAKSALHQIFNSLNYLIPSADSIFPDIEGFIEQIV